MIENYQIIREGKVSNKLRFFDELIAEVKEGRAEVVKGKKILSLQEMEEERKEIINYFCPDLF